MTGRCEHLFLVSNSFFAFLGLELSVVCLGFKVVNTHKRTELVSF